MRRTAGSTGLILVAVFGTACATGGSGDGTDTPPSDAAIGGIDAGLADASLDAGLDACTPQPETCNGRSDDCDAEVDEDFATLGDPCQVGLGECLRSGTMVCNPDGDGVVCDATAGVPAVELCDGLDNNCDGFADEIYDFAVFCDGADTDQCAEAHFICDGNGGIVCGDTTGDNVELCNGLDDDCDLATDEGFGLGVACDGDDADACAEGVVACDGAGGTTCGDATGNSVELCNGVDDDCDLTIDDGFAVGGTCAVGVGACQALGAYVCTGDGLGVSCVGSPGTPTAETCGDAIDQDCNGLDPTCPSNDLTAGAINISAGGTFAVDLGAAHDNYNSSCGLGGGRDVFYTFTLPAAEVVYLDTFGSDYDSTVEVVAGSCAAMGASQACFDDSCAVRQSQGALALAAGTYCVVVDQFNNGQTTGATSLTFTRGGRTGTAISGAGTRTGTTCTGTNVTTGTCQTNSTAKDVGYYFMSCPATPSTVDASTCTGTAFDSVVYVRRAGATTDVACSDDACSLQSSFTGAVVSGAGLNWLVVDGYLANCNTYQLDYNIY